jgi:hypothetical protein
MGGYAVWGRAGLLPCTVSRLLRRSSRTGHAGNIAASGFDVMHIAVLYDYGGANTALWWVFKGGEDGLERHESTT